jgi:hypothetical protein
MVVAGCKTVKEIQTQHYTHTWNGNEVLVLSSNLFVIDLLIITALKMS